MVIRVSKNTTSETCGLISYANLGRFASQFAFWYKKTEVLTDMGKNFS